MKQIKDRQHKDYLPAQQIDGMIEFKPAGIISDVIPLSPNVQTSEDNHYMQMRYQ